MVYHHQPGDDEGILCRHHAFEAFYYDLDFVTPWNIAGRDSDKSVVSKVLEHDFSDPKNKLWLVKWLVNESP